MVTDGHAVDRPRTHDLVPRTAESRFVAQQLKRMSLFADWTDQELEALAATTRRRLWSRGSLILI
jgi:hypothetical protein